MRILFNMVNCGLANNGGCQSVLRMALELRKLGSEVKILVNQPNRFTWFEIPKNLLEEVDEKTYSWPRGWDIIVATGCTTIKDTVHYPYLNSKRKFFWMRAHETWAYSDEYLIELYGLGLNILVNAEWMKAFLLVQGIESRVQYAGLPDEVLRKFGLAKITPRKITLGALYSSKARKRWDDVIQIATALHEDNSLEKLLVFGAEKYKVKSDFPVHDLYNPDIEEKLALMGECDVWLATTINEGLHIPPMEAAMAGANLVARAIPSAGMGDYAINEFTAKTFYSNYEAFHCIIDYLDSDSDRVDHLENLKRIIRQKIGSVNTNAVKMEEIFMGAI